MMKRIIYLMLVVIFGGAVAFAQEKDSVAVEYNNVESGNVKEDGLAVTKGMADSAYISNDFAAAILYYEELLTQNGESADVYYNLGNSYYKSENIAKAILNYERALLLKPGDEDIRFNLEMAQSKTVDKVMPQSELFFITWIKQLRNLNDADSWGKWGIVFFLLFIIFVVLYIFGKQLLLRKIGFGAAVLLLFLVVVTNIFAFQQKEVMREQKGAIVVAPSITVKSTPTDSGTDLFILHEGHKIHIKDDSMKGWKEIVLEDGKVGWVPTSSIEII